MTISPNWQPDMREAYEPELCRLRNVYHVRGASKDFYCDQCPDLIYKGEQHVAAAVSKAGIGGYTRPRRLHMYCKTAYIKRQNERYAEQWGILLSICIYCGVYYGYKDGRGVTGLSGGPCKECGKVWMAEVK